MKVTYFCNKKSLQIVSSSIRNDIQKQINDIGLFNLTSKYYTFLNRKNVNNLKETNFLVTLSTFGKKFILFITIYNKKKYCIFINKKNDTMIVTQLKFADDIFTGTLFDGELVKNTNDKWIFLINDIAYYKGKNIITKSFIERQSIIQNIIINEHQNGDEKTETLFISKKSYFEYKNIKDLIDNYANHLNYKCSGLYFKSVNNFSDNYLFIFPECRSDSKILGGTNIQEQLSSNQNISANTSANANTHANTNANTSANTSANTYANTNANTYANTNTNANTEINKEEDELDDLFGTVEILKDNTKIVHESPKERNNNLKLEKTTCRFLLNNTSMPDIYELYCKNTNNSIEKHSYASVPDLQTSEFLKDLTKNNFDLTEDIKTRLENNKVLFVECNYHKGFKKWIPFKKVDCMDTINTINQIQIILDSL